MRLTRLNGIPSTMLYLFEVNKRSTFISAKTPSKPRLTPCKSPNRRNATTTDSMVRIVRVFLRHNPAQTSMKYFMQPPWNRRRLSDPCPCEFDAKRDSLQADR